MSAVNTAYSGLVGVGRVGSKVGAVVGTIVAALFVIAGIVLLTYKNRPTPDHPNPKPLTWPGWFLVGMGIVVLVLSWASVYWTSKSKPVAAVAGAYDVLESI